MVPPGESTSFTLEFEVRAVNAAQVLFCEDQGIDARATGAEINNVKARYSKCLELVIGGWNGNRSIFRSLPYNNANPLSNKYHGNNKVLNPNSYRNFKIVFDDKGDLSVFKVSDQDYQVELDGLERDENGKLVDLSYVTGVDNYD